MSDLPYRLWVFLDPRSPLNSPHCPVQDRSQYTPREWTEWFPHNRIYFNGIFHLHYCLKFAEFDTYQVLTVLNVSVFLLGSKGCGSCVAILWRGTRQDLFKVVLNLRFINPGLSHSEFSKLTVDRHTCLWDLAGRSAEIQKRNSEAHYITRS